MNATNGGSRETDSFIFCYLKCILVAFYIRVGILAGDSGRRWAVNAQVSGDSTVAIYYCFSSWLRLSGMACSLFYL
jgi:hypothetical protein